MSNRRWADPDPPFRIVTRTTGGLSGALYEDSFRHGAYRHLPIPPADPMLEDWEVADTSDDRWTTWFRRCTDHIAAACLGGPAVAGMTARAIRKMRQKNRRMPA